MKIDITDNSALKRIFKRKITKNVVTCNPVLDGLTQKQKEEYVKKRLEEIRFSNARVVIEYWCSDYDLETVLKVANVDYQVIETFYFDGIKPGRVEVNLSGGVMYNEFVDSLISFHYSTSTYKPYATFVWSYFAFETEYGFRGMHVYDNNGFLEYEVPYI